MNNLADVDVLLNDFLTYKVAEYKAHVKRDTDGDRFSVGEMFIPYGSVFSFESSTINETTESSYLENLMLRVVATSQEVPLQIKDISRQLERTLELNKELALQKVNPPRMHNAALLANINEFESFIRKQVLEHNIPVYLRQLAMLKVGIEYMNRKGLAQWKRTFNYPKEMSSTERMNAMDDFFKNDVNFLIDECQLYFKSKLLRVGELSPLTGR